MGFTTGINKGAFTSGKELLSFAANALIHPINTSSEIYEAFAAIAKLAYNQEYNTLIQALSPEVLDLTNKWEALSPKERGEKSGFIFGKYGSDILLPAASAKAISQGAKGAKELAIIAKNLQLTEKALVLEAALETGVESNAFTKAMYSWKTAETLERLPSPSVILNNINRTKKITTSKDILDILQPNKRWIGGKGAGSKSIVRVFKGSEKEGLNVFNHLTKDGEVIINDGKKIVSKLSDDIHITYRTFSKSELPTININIPSHRRDIKLKFLEN